MSSPLPVRARTLRSQGSQVCRHFCQLGVGVSDISAGGPLRTSRSRWGSAPSEVSFAVGSLILSIAAQVGPE